MILILGAGLCFATDKPDEYRGNLPKGLLRMGDGDSFPPYALIVDKSKKQIYVFDNSSRNPALVDIVDSDLGKKPGDKHATGDHRTPEGVYFFTRLLEGPQLDPIKYGVRAFVTNYPNFFDQREGKSGYGIWLHAIDEKTSLDRGSQGCVVVRNDTIKKLSSYVVLKETPFLIFDRIQWEPQDQVKKDSENVLKAIGDWKMAWETKNIDNYIKYYSTEFKNGKMDRDTWKRFKTELAQKYSDIKINLSMPVMYEHNGSLVVKFFQDYSSPIHSDFGEKTLYVKNGGSGFEILAEDWEPATDPKARSFLANNKTCCH